MYKVYIKGLNNSKEVMAQKAKLALYIKPDESNLFIDCTDREDDGIHLYSVYDRLVGKYGAPLIHKNDVLVISKLSVLGDTYSAIIREIKHLLFMNINFKILEIDEAVAMKKRENEQLDNTTICIMATLLQVIDIEHETKSKYIKKGFEKIDGHWYSVERQRKVGRPKSPRPKNWVAVYRSVYIAKEITVEKALQLLGIKRTKFYQLKQEYEEELSKTNYLHK